MDGNRPPIAAAAASSSTIQDDAQRTFNHPVAELDATTSTTATKERLAEHRRQQEANLTPDQRHELETRRRLARESYEKQQIEDRAIMVLSDSQLMMRYARANDLVSPITYACSSVIRFLLFL